ncbi:glycoside hydrolase family 3 protein [Sphingomonas daechungensis]|uniref:glycoside hydrolase family 3 C-terminal domain-containing protein n=1 Tax=Sphingomonas daechungensis TaxID=1176646 RepID=UPI0031E92FCF
MTKGRTFVHLARLCLLAGTLLPSALQAQAAVQSTPDARERANALASDLVGKMTLEEKLGQMVNVAPAIPRLKVPAYNWWTESLHGAIGSVPTTNYPEPIGLAASFNAPLVKEVAGAIGTEVRALHTLGRQTGELGRIGTGLDTWSPNINIFRDPRWGRGQETYGEDPFLTARIGVAFVEGMQGPNPDLPNVIATPKHFAVHSGPETTRHKANVFVSQHDLEDTYLPAFRAALVEARAQSVMCAYNRVDGQPACASDELLKDHLRGAWKFDGYVVSDCDAVQDISDNHRYAPDIAAGVAAAVRAGVDNECHTATLGPTPPPLWQRYREALDRHLITEADIDRALIRLFAARYRTGDLAGVRQDGPVPASAIGTAEHQALALKAAEESLVLLKNDGILPLKPGARIAVIGPLGDATRVLRGNYSSPASAPPISVLDGLRRALPHTQVVYAPAGESMTDGDPVPASVLETPEGKRGLLARFYNALPGALGRDGKPMAVSAKPAATAIVSGLNNGDADMAAVDDDYRVVWTGFFVPPESGSYRLGLSGWRNGRFTFDGQPLVEFVDAPWGSLPKLKTVRVEKGRRYPIQIVADAHGETGVGLTWKYVSEQPEADLRAAAANADVIIAIVGLTSDLEGEESSVERPGFKGGDKTTLDLPTDQRKLLEQAKATGKPLVVVAMNGSPINLDWEKQNANAILEAWYPGQSGGLAVANVLSGRVDAGGRLPLTFYKNVNDLPPFDDYAMAGRTYRYFAGTPVYPFGYGLSFTSFAYSSPAVVRTTDGGARVSVEVRNTGPREGNEVAQLYLDFPDAPGTPRLALRGFQRLSLKPGEVRALTFNLSTRDLSSVTPEGRHVVLAGNYTVSVGSGQPGTGVPSQSASLRIEKAIALPK